MWRLRSSSSSSDSGGGSDGLQLEAAATWKVPNCSGGASWQNRCQFGATRDGCYIAVVRFIAVLPVLEGLEAAEGALSTAVAALPPGSCMQAAARPPGKPAHPCAFPCRPLCTAGQQQGRLLCV